MNVLPFTLSFILILTTMSFAAYQNYKDFIVSKEQKQIYFSKTGHTIFNDKQLTLYIRHKKKDPEQEENLSEVKDEIFNPASEFEKLELEEEENKKTSRLHPKLDIYILFNPDEPKHAKIKEIFKKLLQHLYGKADFFLDLEQKYPNFLEDFIQNFIQGGMGLKTQSRKYTRDLGNVEFQNSDYRLALYKMLNGTKSTTSDRIGYPSLKNFIELNSKSGSLVSIFLAPKDLLFVLFDNLEVVDQIFNDRKNLKDQNVFSSKFSSLLAVDPSLVTFEISSSHPKNY